MFAYTRYARATDDRVHAGQQTSSGGADVECERDTQPGHIVKSP